MTPRLTPRSCLSMDAYTAHVRPTIRAFALVQTPRLAPRTPRRSTPRFPPSLKEGEAASAVAVLPPPSAGLAFVGRGEDVARAVVHPDRPLLPVRRQRAADRQRRRLVRVLRVQLRGRGECVAVEADPGHLLAPRRTRPVLPPLVPRDPVEGGPGRSRRRRLLAQRGLGGEDDGQQRCA